MGRYGSLWGAASPEGFEGPEAREGRGRQGAGNGETPAASPEGSRWVPMGSYGSLWVPYGSLWVPMGPYGSLWVPMAPYGFLWVPMGPYGFLWVPMGSYGSLWVGTSTTPLF